MKFKDVMKRMFGDSDFLSADTKFFDKTMVSPIGQGLVAKVEIETGKSPMKYDRLKLTIISKTKGIIDCQEFKFKDIFGVESWQSPYLVDGSDKVYWSDHNPTIEDYEKAKETVENYIKVYSGEEIQLGGM